MTALHIEPAQSNNTHKNCSFLIPLSEVPNCSVTCTHGQV